LRIGQMGPIVEQSNRPLHPPIDFVSASPNVHFSDEFPGSEEQDP
jgi:hypothetical protein